MSNFLNSLYICDHDNTTLVFIVNQALELSILYTVCMLCILMVTLESIIFLLSADETV